MKVVIVMRESLKFLSDVRPPVREGVLQVSEFNPGSKSVLYIKTIQRFLKRFYEAFVELDHLLPSSAVSQLLANSAIAIASVD